MDIQEEILKFKKAINDHEKIMKNLEKKFSEIKRKINPTIEHEKRMIDINVEIAKIRLTMVILDNKYQEILKELDKKE